MLVVIGENPVRQRGIGYSSGLVDAGQAVGGIVGVGGLRFRLDGSTTWTRRPRASVVIVWLLPAESVAVTWLLT
ncbi:MAG TPA: hypothetical protein VNY05_11085 [Candidatus Acidoferrales bacterium]|nr:hypothetical protein [Candidatus Acidoferrales bacterium]